MARTSGMSRRIIQRICTRVWASGVGTVLIEPPSMERSGTTGCALALERLAVQPLVTVIGI